MRKGSWLLCLFFFLLVVFVQDGHQRQTTLVNLVESGGETETTATPIIDNQPFSSVAPSAFFRSHSNPCINPSQLYVGHSATPIQTGNWAMNMVTPGGYGFYQMQVVPNGQVQDATKQISVQEVQSLGLNATVNQTLTVPRDVFQPNVNQLCWFIQGSPVGLRFSNQETFTNNSAEFSPNREWAFSVSAAESLLPNPLSGPPEPNNPNSWPFRATKWTDLGVQFQYTTISSTGFLSSPQVRLSPFQTFRFSDQITPLFSLVGNVVFSSITPTSQSSSTTS